MKNIKKILLISTAVLGLTACGQKDKGVLGQGKDVSLRVSWWGGDERHALTLEAIKAFEAKNPGIKIVPEYSGWQGHPEKIATQMAGNTAPDVMQVNWDWLFTFSKTGEGYYDLNKLKDTLKLENYSSEILASTTINGKLNALPQGVAGKIFLYNKTTYDKAGLPIPTTLAELRTAAKVMKEKLGPEYFPFYLDEYGTFLLSIYMLEQETGKGFIEDGKVAYTVDQLEKAFKFCTSLVAEGVTPSALVRAGGGNVSFDQRPGWIRGQYAGVYEWDSGFKKHQDALEPGMNLVVGEFPKDFGTHNSAFSKISMAFAINKNTKHPEESAKFIHFLTSDPDGVKILKTSRGIPASKAADEVLRTEGILAGLAYEGNQKVLQNAGKPISPNFENRNLQSLYKDTMEQLGYGKITERQTAEIIINRVNEFLANQK